MSEELAPWLEKPVKFLYKEGKVEKIFCGDEEPEYVLNIKRGILAFINHNFTKLKEDADEPRMYNNWEVIAFKEEYYSTLVLSHQFFEVSWS